MCLVILETCAWPIPAPSAQVNHAIKHNRFMPVTFALEDVSTCSCFRLSRLNIFGVPGCCYFIRRVFMKASALRWTCSYEGQRIALYLWVWRPEQLVPTRQPPTSSIVFSNVDAVASIRCRRAVKVSLPVFFFLRDTDPSFVSSTRSTIPCAVGFTV